MIQFVVLAFLVGLGSAGVTPTPKTGAGVNAVPRGSAGFVEPPQVALLRADAERALACESNGACAATSAHTAPAARHYMLDAAGCPFERVDAAASLATAMRSMATGAALAQGAGTVEKEFEPQGVTILHLHHVGHVTVHTWPEYGAALFDLLAPAEALATPEEAEKTLLSAAAALGCTRSGLRRVARPAEVTPVSPAFETPLAKHVFVDATDCPAATLADAPSLVSAADDCAVAANLTEVGMVTRFSTQSPERHRADAPGVGAFSGPWTNSKHLAKLMEESHIAVHALPAVGSAYLDVMTCAPLSIAQVDEIRRAAKDRLGCASVTVHVEERGI